MFFFLVVAFSVGWGLLVSQHRPKTHFLSNFAKLLERPELVRGLENTLAHRMFLKGEFRGRNVVVLVQNARGTYGRKLVVSMETHARLIVESYEFAGDRDDREGAQALFALETKHEFVLRHEECCLKARWAPHKTLRFFGLDFPFDFKTEEGRCVLEAMDTLAGSIERRYAAALAT